MAKFMQSRRKMLIAAGEVAAVGVLGYFGLKHFLSSEKDERSGAKLKVVFMIAPDGLGVERWTQGLWHPTVSGGGDDSQNFTLKAISGELEAYKSQSLYLNGLMVGAGNAGHGYPKQILRDKAYSQSSIDTILGEVMPGLSPTMRVLYATPHNQGGDLGHFSWVGNSNRSIETNPRVLFQRVFGTGMRSADSGGAHILDLALDDITELRGQLGAGSQREKLDTQLDAVEQLADDLDQDTGPAPQCSPEEPDGSNHMSSGYRNETTLAHMQVVATALSCGLLRVATVTMGKSSDQVTLPVTNGLPGINKTNPHAVAHREGGATQQEWEYGRRWYVRQAKLLLDELSKRPDPDAPGDNLLQHTLVVFTSEMSDGKEETAVNMPVVLMGGASGKLQSGSGGRVFNLASQGETSHWAVGKQADMQRLWATIARVAGTTVPYGGDITPLTGIFNS